MHMIMSIWPQSWITSPFIQSYCEADRNEGKEGLNIKIYVPEIWPPESNPRVLESSFW